MMILAFVSSASDLVLEDTKASLIGLNDATTVSRFLRLDIVICVCL